MEINNQTSYKIQTIYKYVPQGTGFFMVETKYFYVRNSLDFHVYIIIEQEGQCILFPISTSFIQGMKKIIKKEKRERLRILEDSVACRLTEENIEDNIRRARLRRRRSRMSLSIREDNIPLAELF